MCLFHAWASHLVSSPADGHNKKWIFPGLYKLKQPASSVNAMVQGLVKSGIFGTDPSNTARYSGTSLRIGAVNQMMLHPSMDLTFAILRGGWSFDSVVTIFTYLLKLLVFLAMAGRSLCGWRDIKSGGKAPSLDPCNDQGRSSELIALTVTSPMQSSKREFMLFNTIPKVNDDDVRKALLSMVR